MQVIYIGESFPNKIEKSIYLAGTNSESDNWKQKALEILELLEYDGCVFISQWKDNVIIDSKKEYQWTETAIKMSDNHLFYFDRENDPAIVATDLYGSLKNRNTTVLVSFNDNLNDFQEYHSKHTFKDLYNGLLHIVNSQTSTIRHDGERFIPQHIFNSIQFQNWYKQHKLLGNWISDANLLFEFIIKDFTFAFILHINMFIKNENRYKNNEFIFSRTDISSCVLYKLEADIKDSKIVLISEFRTPVNNSEGIVYELPGGSSNNLKDEAKKVVEDEIFEETGFKIKINKLVNHSDRQLCSTLSTHKSALFSYELDEMEFNILKLNDNKVFGNTNESEYTTVKIYTLNEILENDNIDWSNIGQIMTVMKKFLID